MHPLRRSFIDVVEDEYGVSVGGIADVARLDVISEKIMNLGICYATFVSLAFALWDTFACEQDWEYPYWNVVFSDRTFDSISKLLELEDVIVDIPDHQDDYNMELMYACDYVRWVNGAVDERPKRCNGKPNADVRDRVAESMCNQFGIRHTSSNYMKIAIQCMT